MSSIGFVLFKYGRKQRRVPHTGVGALMLVYPYVITDVPVMLLIASLLCGLLWLGVRMGL